MLTPLPRAVNFGTIKENNMKKGVRKIGRIIKTAIKIAGFCLVIFILMGLAAFAYFIKDLPDPSKIDQREIVQSTKIYDRTGETILYDIHGEEKRTIVPFEQIPQTVKDATVAAEDDNFYHHFGLDWRGILRAALANLRGKRISQGGSTITQQYIKNAYLGGPQAERTFSRKAKEAILALILEVKYNKNEILGFYLNQVPYGSNAYGIEAASQTFFNKSTRELTLAESTLLAALPQAPSYYSPYGSHPDSLKQRQEYVLDRMAKFGYTTEEEAKQAKSEELKYTSQTELKAHHFVTMVKEYLEEKYSQFYADINRAGLKVYTTLDWDLQQIAEQVVAEGVEVNKKNYRAENAALAAIDPKTGQVLTLVGSRSYEEEQFNVAISPYRHPGSSFKPFAYAAAFEKGYTPQTMLFDLETNFRGDDIKDYIPKNYDMRWRGPISMKDSLAQSINITSVKTLYLADIYDTIDLAQAMGITTLKDRSRYGLSLVLGGGEVKLLDETAAYAVFADEGTKHPLSLILRIEDNHGDVLENYKDNPQRVLSQQTARQINDILSDEAARVPTFGEHSKLYLAERPVAAKTGTTQDYSDGWTVGYTPSLAVGVWAGNNDFKDKMKQGAAGIYVAAPIWNEFIQKAYQAKTKTENLLSNEDSPVPNKPELKEFTLSKKVEYFNSPEQSPEISTPMLGGELAYKNKVAIDRISGKLATNLTPPELIEERIYEEAHCILHYVDKEDPLGDYPENPSQNPQFEAWENTVLAWVSGRSCSDSGICYNQKPPTQFDDVHIPENQPSVEITSPKQNTSVNASSRTIITVKAKAEAKLGIKQLDFFVNNQLVDSDATAPYSTSFNILPYLDSSGRQTIKVRAYDKVLNSQEDKVTIRVDF